ncbi:MAG: phosphoglycerate kinase [Bacteroidales bacterium]|nr:phosphoglycerate kinase [Bacteroidales bacterium]MDY6348203.1 phosphoglycerate kinase [Bacteroidales bacterium]
MKSINEHNFKGERALIRVDYNVPLNEKFEVTDTTRIERTRETINKILGDGGSVILLSHLGRPKGEAKDEFSLRHIVGKVSEILEKDVIFGGDVLSEEAVTVCSNLKPGEVALMENLRFHKEEEKGDAGFAESIARLGDVYVNDAFGTAHREHASTATVARFFNGKAFAGFLMYNEVMNLEKTLNGQVRPFTAIIGGSKVSTKINILKNLLHKVDNLVVGGGLSYTFLKAMGLEIGNSLFEPDMLDVAKDILKEVDKTGVNFVVRLDSVCADRFSNDANILIPNDNNIPEGWEGLDIGPKSRRNIAQVIKNSNTILWNGPVGVFELENFSKGTRAVALSVAAATLAGAYSIVGGGDSIAAINKYDLGDYISYISTGGGAMLEYLEGKELPGVKALNEN